MHQYQNIFFLHSTLPSGTLLPVCVVAGEMTNMKKENKRLRDELRNLRAALEWVYCVLLESFRMIQRHMIDKKPLLSLYYNEFNRSVDAPSQQCLKLVRVRVRSWGLGLTFKLKESGFYLEETLNKLFLMMSTCLLLLKVFCIYINTFCPYDKHHNKHSKRSCMTTLRSWLWSTWERFLTQRPCNSVCVAELTVTTPPIGAPPQT